MKLPLSKYVWLDGKYIPTEKATIPITTHAIHYGTSVFEGIRAYWSVGNLFIFRLYDHIKRFRKSGSFYNMSLNFSDSQINNAIIGLCKKNKIKKSCYIRPFYFIGEYGINLHVTNMAPTHAAAFVFPLGHLFDKNGISVGVSSWRKFSDVSTPPQAKMGGNYLNSIIATQEAKNNGFDEAILLDHTGNVSEAPGENIFIVRDEKIITPTLSSSALDGITRDTVITIAKDLDMDVIQRDIPRSEIYLADEIFLTGTAAEITPVTCVDKKKINDGIIGDVTKKLISSYHTIVRNKNSHYSHWLTAVY
ncbi:MAG: branched-chain amino acid transaminase [Thaumarchaeota archaeon]|nr:branched-chain amino acid transaminase [Nitrososphaerota archaeon]